MAIYDANISAIINKRVKDAFVYRVPIKIDFEIYFLFNFFFHSDSVPRNGSYHLPRNSSQRPV